MIESNEDPYLLAIGHYASPERDDLVKIRWERPYLTGLLRASIRFLRSELADGDRELHVLDVGAGAGEAFDLIAEAARQEQLADGFRYTALDRSAAMLRLAEDRVRSPGVFRPVVADMRHFRYAEDPAQLYLSVGAPYSELSRVQLTSVLREILAAIAGSPEPSVVIVDVYGRHCLAWLPVAAESWTYSMTFFRDTARPPVREMAFYTPGELERLLRESLPEPLSVRMAELTFVDRSVFASRHTATGDYNASLPRIRTILNEVLAGDEKAASKLRIPPEAVTRTLAFAKLDWNVADNLDAAIGRWNEIAAAGGPGVGARLAALNNMAGGRAVGAAHYLTMIVSFSASRHSNRSASSATSGPS